MYKSGTENTDGCGSKGCILEEGFKIICTVEKVNGRSTGAWGGGEGPPLSVRLCTPFEALSDLYRDFVHASVCYSIPLSCSAPPLVGYSKKKCPIDLRRMERIPQVFFTPLSSRDFLVYPRT